MFQSSIPFEIHLTISDLPQNQIDNFANFCLQHQAKPLLIELSQGEHIHQPMLSKILYSDSLDKILVEATAYSHLLQQHNFQVNRLKIEVPAYCTEYIDNLEKNQFEGYYEWHGKINYEKVNELKALCLQHKAHLSLNALKNENLTRFITLREFGTKEIYDQRINKLVEALHQNGWQVQKQQAEYCVYDNNVFLDKGWLPK